MATKTCTSCGGSGYNSMRGVIPGSQKNASPCSTCGGKGWVYDNSDSYSNGGNGGCFTGETKVKVPGGWKLIQDLNPNELVVSFDKNGKLVNRRIVKVKKLTNKKVQTVITDLHSINVTPGHSIKLPNGNWKRVRIRNDSAYRRQLPSTCHREWW